MKKSLYILLLFLLLTKTGHSQERADIIVSKDGSGNFTTIQEALNSVPDEHENLIIILIKNGSYNEKLFIKKSNIALVGENRDSTRIIFAELRMNWAAKNPDRDMGSATVNIDSSVVNLTIANLTIYNNYGSLYGDHNHQYAILSKGNKIIIINSNVIADGADTISMWKTDGMTYHANCYFEGWVDYVCPRGWCYITDSKFFGHNLTASIWHNGWTNEDQKFVIEHSYFDGVPGFPLGRHHRDGAFYLLDCIFSENMADIPIFWPVSPNAKKWIWGDRQYYYNCHRLGGDYNWFKDNLSTAKGSPKPEEVTAKWTFAGKWDPEVTMPAVLPFVFLPSPRNGSYDIDNDNVVLKWFPSRNAVSHNIYFWKSKFPQALKNGEKLRGGADAPGAPVFMKNQIENSFTIGQLETNATYYWRVDEVMSNGSVITGPLWHFTTK